MRKKRVIAFASTLTLAPILIMTTSAGAHEPVPSNDPSGVESVRCPPQPEPPDPRAYIPCIDPNDPVPPVPDTPDVPHSYEAVEDIGEMIEFHVGSGLPLPPTGFLTQSVPKEQLMRGGPDIPTDGEGDPVPDN